MPYYTGGGIGPDPQGIPLDNYQASFGRSLATSIDEAWQSNPSHVAIDYFRLRSANSGAKLERSTAEKMIADAGVKLTVPEDGYTADALDIIIRRKQEEILRQDTMARAPSGILPTGTRFAAQLMTGLADPLNIAAAFVPVVGQARYASMLARAGESALARAGTRATVGALEGAAGAGLLEPGIHFARTQLQDDYHMGDSLLNVAFGATLGAALHVGAAAVGELLHGGGNPAARYVGLSAEDVRTVWNFERQRTGMVQADVQRALDSFSPEVRRAIGEPSTPEMATARTVDVGQRDPMSAAAIDARVSPEIRETAVRAAIADLVRGRTPDVENILRVDPAHAAPVQRAAGQAVPTPEAPGPLDNVRATSERQAAPESVSVGDFFAARAADERLAQVPKTPRLDAATQDMEKAVERARTLAANLEHGGMDSGTTQAMLASLKPWDDAVHDATNLGAAVRAAALCGLRT